MFAAVFGDDLWFLAGLTVVAAVVGPAARALARRRQVPRSLWWLALAFCLTGVLGVTLALRGGGAGRAECVINHEITEPLYTAQGLWNLAMSVPLGMFGGPALRRPLPVLFGVLALPCLVELTQALVPLVSGICDSADVEMNAVGGRRGRRQGAAEEERRRCRGVADPGRRAEGRTGRGLARSLAGGVVREDH